MKLIHNTAIEIVALLATGLFLPLVCLAALHNTPVSGAAAVCDTPAVAQVSNGTVIGLQTKDSNRG